MDFQTFRQFADSEAAALHIEEYELYYQLEESASVSAFRREVQAQYYKEGGAECE